MVKELISYLSDPADTFKKLKFDYYLEAIHSVADVTASLQATAVVLKRQYLKQLDNYIKMQEQESIFFYGNNDRTQAAREKCNERIAAANILKSAFSKHLKNQALTIMLVEEQRIALRNSFAVSENLVTNFSGLPSLLWPIITIKNSIKLMIEHVPYAVGTASHTLLDYLFIHWPDESSYPARWRRWLALVGSAAGVVGSGLLYALASVIHQTTRRLTSPIASFKEVWSIHPVLGVGSALLSIAWGMLATAVAAPVTVFFVGKAVGAQAAASLTSFFAKLGAVPALQKIGHVVATLAQPVWDALGMTASSTAITGTAVLGGILTAVLNPLRALVSWILPRAVAAPATPPSKPGSPISSLSSRVESESKPALPHLDLGLTADTQPSPMQVSEQTILAALTPVPESPRLAALRGEAESIADIPSPSSNQLDPSGGNFSLLQGIKDIVTKARNRFSPRSVSVEEVGEGELRSSTPDLHK